MSFLEAIVDELHNLFSFCNYAIRHPLEEREKRYTIARPAVLIFHGFLVGRPSMQGMTNYLKEEGISAKRICYPCCDNLYQTRDYLIERIDILCQLRESKIKLVGHSQGGLLAVSIAQDRPDLINTVVALGSPFYGTKAAYIGFPISSCKQMLPKSDFLKEFYDKGFPDEVKFYSIYSAYDEMVIPSENAILPEADNITNICVKNTGHLGLTGPKCYGLVKELLEQ